MKKFTSSLKICLLLTAMVVGVNDVWGISKTELTVNISGGGQIAVNTSTSKPFSYSSVSVTKSQGHGVFAIGITDTYYIWVKANSGYTCTGVSDCSWNSNGYYTISFKGSTTTNKKTVTAIFKSTYSVAFNGNGSTSGSMSNQNFVYDEEQNLTNNVFSKHYVVTFDANGGSCLTASTNSEVSFTGWATSAGGDKKYKNGESVKNLTTTAGGTVNLYAKWGSATAVILPNASKADGSLFDGWYIGEKKIGNAGDPYIPTADVTLKAKWVSKRNIEIVNNVPTTIKVGQIISDAFTFTFAENPSVSYSVLSIDPINSGSGEIVAYDKTTNKLTALNAGSVKIVFTQASTATMASSTEEFVISVEKNTPVFSQLINSSDALKTIAISSFFASTNPDTELAFVSQDSKTSVASGNIYVYDQTGDAHIKVSQAENYFWAAKEETYTLSIGAATAACWSGELLALGDCYIYSNNQGKFLNDNNGWDAEPIVLWTVSGTVSTNYSLTSENGKQFAMYREGRFLNYKYHVVTNATGKSGSDVQLSSTDDNDSHFYSLYRNSKDEDWSGDRNVRSTATGVERTRDASNEWMFISVDQYDFYQAKKNAQNYLATKTVPGHIKNVLVAAIAANDCESTNSYAARTANLNNAIDVYDAYFEVKEMINASSAEQSAKDAALLELDNNRTTREALEAVLAMLKNSAFVTNNYAGQTIYVGDDLANVFTFDGCSPFGADFSVLSIVNNSIAAERNPSHPDDVLEYNSTTNSMAIYNAGQATITFRQNETDDYYAKDIEVVFNVVKRDPEYTYCTTNDRVYFNRQYPTFVVSTNTECTFSALTSSNTAVATVEEVSTGTIKMVVSDQAQSTTITFEQPGNYQFNPSGVQAFTFTPKEAHDHVPFTLTSGNYETYAYNHVSSGGFAWKNGGILLGAENIWTATEDLRWDDRYVDLQFSGIADKLSFSFERSVSIATDCDWYVKESVDGSTWTEIWKKDDTNSGSASNIQVSPDAHYLRLCYSGNYGGYFKNVNVTELKYFTVSESSLNWGSHYVGDTGDKSFVFRHANAARVTTITAPEHFQISLDGISFASSVVVATSGVDLYGEQTVYVRYLTDEVNTCNDAVLIVSDGTNEETILLSGSTVKYPTAVIVEPQFEIYVGQDPATVEFGTPWTVQETINHTGVDGTFATSTPTEFLSEVMGQTITVVFTPTQANKYEECSFTTSKNVLRREVVFDGDQDEAWAKDGNWNVDSAPSEYDDVRISNSVVVSTDVEVHGLTIEAGTSVTVGAGATLTIGDGGSRDAAEYGDLIIEAGAKVVFSNADVKVRNFYINTELGDDTHAGVSSSSQLDGSTHLEVLGDAFIDIKMDPSGEISYGFYDFVLPFPCDAKTGVSYIDATGAEHPMVLNRDYAFSAFSEATRATGAYAWSRFNGVLEAGLAYSITLDDDYPERNVIRFRKTATGAINTSNTTALQVSDGNDVDKGWNGIGNATLSYADLSSAGVSMVQVYSHATNSYSPVDIDAFTYVVGSSFFVQVGAAQDMTFVRQNNPSVLRAPSRNADDSNEQFMIEFAAEQSDYTADRLYLSADEDALSTYEIGHDLLKFGNPNEAKKAQISGLGYGKNLCQMHFPMLNNEAVFPVSLFAPAAGDYVLRAAGVVDGQDLYLLENGVPVWNLSDGEYTLSLDKGSNTDYSLAIRANAPAVPTGTDAVASDADVEKMIINGALFVRKNGMIFDAMGNRVK